MQAMTITHQYVYCDTFQIKIVCFSYYYAIASWLDKSS